jgi:hypothetical protein
MWHPPLESPSDNYAAVNWQHAHNPEQRQPAEI